MLAKLKISTGSKNEIFMFFEWVIVSKVHFPKFSDKRVMIDAAYVIYSANNALFFLYNNIAYVLVM